MPSLCAAMERMPLPLPASRRDCGCFCCRAISSCSRQKRVVKWPPVPKLSPGFMMRFLRSSAGGSSQ